jgi:threonine dehydrogenase-like Zn-dependent dehydrogenase
MVDTYHGAAVLTAVRTMEQRMLPDARPGPHDVLVRVLTTGICGSDLSTYRGTHLYKTAPTVLGHELCGTVLSVGVRVKHVKRGDLVCAAAYSPCEACQACLSGALNLCSDRRNLSHLGWHGSFAQQVLLRSNMVFRLADHVAPEAGAMAEPLSIALHAVRLGEQGGTLGNVAIVGAGGIGLCCSLAVRRRGAASIACIDLGRAKERLAKAAGADIYIDAAESPATRSLVSLWSSGADVTFVASGHQGALDDACAMTRRGGRIVVISYFDQPQSVSVNPFVAGELTVLFSFLSLPRDFAEVTGWLAEDSVDPRSLITHRFDLSKADDALRLLDAPPGGVGKVMIRVPEGLS